ncbi:MAG TPA: hypothetical protein VGN01_15780 [Acidobacteriaceae bacterium]
MRETAIAIALVSLVCLTTGRAQDAAKPGPSTMMTTDADPGWGAVTVKPSDPNEEGQTIRMRGRPPPAPGQASN